MRTLVYGAGGVGAFFGGLLARAGRDVRFVARGPQLDALRTRGLRIDSLLLGPIALGPVAAFASAAEAGPADLALVCVKAHQTAGILDDLSASVHPATSIVPLQNGVESDEVLAGRFGQERVAAAVVYVGATLDAPGVVRHVAAGTIALGARPGFDAARLPAIREALAAGGQPVRISEDIQRDRWHKLVWNAGFNPVSALTGRVPSELLAAPASRALVRGLMLEVVAVARAQAIPLGEKDVDDQIAWTEGASAIRTSMMVDRERGRPMEGDALVGVVVRKGRDHGVPTPLSEVVWTLLQTADAPQRTSTVQASSA